MNTVITAESGVHGHAVPPQLASFVERHLEARGVTGRYKLRWGAPLPIRHGDPFTARKVNLDKRNVELVLTLRTSGPSHVCWLTNDNGTAPSDLWLEDLLHRLRQPPVDPAPTASTATATNKSSDSFTDDADRVHAALATIKQCRTHDAVAVKRALAARFPEIGTNNRTWGQLIGWLGRKGLLDLEHHNYGGIKHVRLSVQGQALLPATAFVPITNAAQPSVTAHTTTTAATGELGRQLSGALARLKREEDTLTMAVLERAERLAVVEREVGELRDAQARDERRLSTVTARIDAVKLLSTEDINT